MRTLRVIFSIVRNPNYQGCLHYFFFVIFWYFWGKINRYITVLDYTVVFAQFISFPIVSIRIPLKRFFYFNLLSSIFFDGGPFQKTLLILKILLWWTLVPYLNYYFSYDVCAWFRLSECLSFCKKKLLNNCTYQEMLL